MFIHSIIIQILQKRKKKGAIPIRNRETNHHTEVAPKACYKVIKNIITNKKLKTNVALSS
jgi:hypothetical protein